MLDMTERVDTMVKAGMEEIKYGWKKRLDLSYKTAVLEEPHLELDPISKVIHPQEHLKVLQEI
jgi:hypothetical protein